MTNKDGISVDEVRALVGELRKGEWDNIFRQGPNNTGFCQQSDAPRRAADALEAQERAYLALSERVGELEKAASLAACYFEEGGKLGRGVPTIILKQLRAALSHKGMDHG